MEYVDRMKIKSLSVVIVACILFEAAATFCFGWGLEGHMTVGSIAEQFLTPKAKEEVGQILNGEHLGDLRVAGWADYIRGHRDFKRIYPNNKKWHYADIDITATNLVLPADKNDVVDQVIVWQKVLAQTNAEPQKRRDALRFLVHFTGDMHQPLHLSFRDEDRGGNLLPIHSFEGGFYVINQEIDPELQLNLHATWDECLVLEAINWAEQAAFVQNLIKDIQPGQVSEWEKGTVKDWAWQTHQLSPTHVYRFTDGTPLPEAAEGKDIDLTETNYITANVPIVRMQLERAGVRLATLINRALDPAPAPAATPEPAPAP